MIFKSTLFHLKEIGSIRHRKYTCTDVSSDESLLLFFRTICVFENNKDRTLCKKCFNQEYTNALEYWRLQWQTHKISTRYLDSKIINDKINAAIICVNKNDELKTYVVGPVHDDRYVGYLSPLGDEKDNFKKKTNSNKSKLITVNWRSVKFQRQYLTSNFI